MIFIKESFKLFFTYGLFRNKEKYNTSICNLEILLINESPITFSIFVLYDKDTFDLYNLRPLKYLKQNYFSKNSFSPSIMNADEMNIDVSANRKTVFEIPIKNNTKFKGIILFPKLNEDQQFHDKEQKNLNNRIAFSAEQIMTNKNKIQLSITKFENDDTFIVNYNI